MSHDFIPCRANLHRRHIEPVGTCGLCGKEDESTFHALTQRSLAVSFWDRLKSITGIKLPQLHLAKRTSDLLDQSHCPDDARGVILCGMWSLWSSRNDRWHGKALIDIGVAIDWALEACLHLSAVDQSKESGNNNALAVRWKPPDQGALKINNDGAFDSDSCTGATGAVLRCSNGSCLASSARWLGSVGSALLAEAEALRDGLRLIPASESKATF